MSSGYVAVGWSPGKKRYDAVVWGAAALYLGLFVGVGLAVRPEITAETLLIRAFGTLALTLLHVVLAIGPLARLDRRFLPLLWNRRHLGVTMFFFALAHGGFALFQFHALGDRNPLVSLLTSSTQWGSIANFPFQQLGAAALVILFLMAATSHDFWLTNLTAPVWKTLHMLVYLAYALLVGHVAFGVLQDATSSLPALALGGGLVSLVVLHLAAAWKGRALDREIAGLSVDGFVEACRVGDIREKRARIVTLAGERVAIFRYDGQLSAVSNVCQHQNGPLGEGRILDGCITCPWHGFQYRPADGASPAPFTERVPTFRLRLVDGDRVFVDPRPLPPGTFVEPVVIADLDWERKKGSVKEEATGKSSVKGGVEAGGAAVGRSGALALSDEEFFVGFLPVPPGVARFARGVAGVALVGFAAVAGVLASSQRPLGQGQYAWDEETEYGGRLQTLPVAGLWTRPTGAAAGTPFTGAFLPLVGEGKHGPPPHLLAAGERDLALLGRRIERYGKQLIEVVEEVPSKASGEASATGGSVTSAAMAPPAQVALGRQVLRGEIVDSKCFLGVMKPATGKVHRDCAIRCISGGAPPAFVVRIAGEAGSDGAERTLVLLLAAADGAPLGPRILDLVAEPVEISGEVSRLGDQLVLATDPASIRRIRG
ncbi:MAG: Rieske 2Fe-2S domain-containing protein [Thermoanaerobaculia bacterium]